MLMVVAMKKLRILFLCTGNSCRSQMAEGWARHFHSDKYEVFSAGIEKHGMNARAVQVMQECGVDIARQFSKTLEDLGEMQFDRVFTVCGHAHENCPYFPGSAEVVHVGFDDPPTLTKNFTDEEEILGCYRRVRDEIRDWIKGI